MTELVKTHDVGDVLLSYIGTENFKKAVADLSLEAQGAFMSGIGMAGVLILANCDKYYVTDQQEIDRLREKITNLESELSWQNENKFSQESERLEDAARNGDVYL